MHPAKVSCIAALLLIASVFLARSQEPTDGNSPAISLATAPDITGPRPIQAVVLSNGSSNIIHVVFNEPLLIGVENEAVQNFQIVGAGTNKQLVTITNVQIASPSVLLRIGATNDWKIGGDYYLILNNLTDSKGNIIAPNTLVPIGWPTNALVIRTTDAWNYHVSAQIDPQVYDENWAGTNYTQNLFWVRDSGPFCAGGAVFGDTCMGACGFQFQFGFQAEPTLFRTTFIWPTNWLSTANLKIRTAFDDGFVLYLNGREIARRNVASSVTRMTPATRTTTNTTVECSTNLLLMATNLLPGTNWFAAATVDSGSDGVTVFALEMEVGALFGPPVPTDVAPTLQQGSVNGGSLRLWWNGYGFTLESVTNLTDNLASAPVGPWQQVPRLSNPYTNAPDGRSRFFRLRK